MRCDGATCLCLPSSHACMCVLGRAWQQVDACTGMRAAAHHAVHATSTKAHSLSPHRPLLHGLIEPGIKGAFGIELDQVKASPKS